MTAWLTPRVAGASRSQRADVENNKGRYRGPFLSLAGKAHIAIVYFSFCI